MEECLRAEIIVAVSVWNAHDGYHVTCIIEQWSIQHPESVAGHSLSVGVESLVAVPDVVEHPVVDAAAEQQLLKHFRCGGPYDLPSLGINGNIRLRRIADLFQ